MSYFSPCFYPPFPLQGGVPLKFRIFSSMLLTLLLFLPLSVTTALAYTVPSDTVVYATDSGTKYHRLDCTHLHSSRSMTIERAERAGYEPCSRCNPDCRTGRYVSDWDGDSGSSSSRSRRNSGSSNSKSTSEKEPSLFSVIMSTIKSIFFYVSMIFSIVFYGLLFLSALFSAIIEKIKRFKNRK